MLQSVIPEYISSVTGVGIQVRAYTKLSEPDLTASASLQVQQGFYYVS